MLQCVAVCVAVCVAGSCGLLLSMARPDQICECHSDYTSNQSDEHIKMCVSDTVWPTAENAPAG